MIPDSFYKINSDAKTNSLAGLSRDEKRLRTDITDRKKDFSRILSNKEKGKEGEEDPDDKLVKGDETLAELEEGDPKQDKRKTAVKPFLDPTTNQTETLAKDSKVAPRLGKEKTIAPSEQPWSEPYIEKTPDATPPIGFHKNEQGELKDSQNAFTDSPAMLFSRIAKEGSPLKQMPKQKLADFVPKSNELEITIAPYTKEEGFSLITLKPQDQDIALINLAVVALSPSDMLVDASKLKPVVKISPFIMDLVEKISNEIKDDTTKTTITLRNAGIFSGVEVTITAFKTARSEINIQFANMTQEAKSLLEINLDALKQALDNKGHTVHIITATTLRDEPVVATGAPSYKEKDEERKEGQNQNREKKEQEEENA